MDSNPTASLWDVWTPASSWKLAFLFIWIGLSVTVVGAWAAWHLPIASSMQIACSAAIALLGCVQTLWIVRQYALLRAKHSVDRIEWIWRESSPLWRVTQRDGVSHDIEAWLPDSLVTYWGCCLAYSSNTLKGRFLPTILVVLPGQLNRSSYRLLCKRILDGVQDKRSDRQ